MIDHRRLKVVLNLICNSQNRKINNTKVSLLAGGVTPTSLNESRRPQQERRKMKKHDNISSFEPELNKRKNALLSFERLHMKDLLFTLYDIAAVTVAYFFAL